MNSQTLSLLETRPPIFVGAYPEDGLLRECLLEAGETAPDWFAGRLTVVARFPSGDSLQQDVDDASPETAYETCARFIDADFHWKPRSWDRWHVEKAEIEVWSKHPVSLTTENGWLRIEGDGIGVVADAGNGFLVVKQSTGRIVHSLLAGHVWLEPEYRGDEKPQLVVRTAAAFGRVGAMWNYNGHSNHIPGSLLAERLLRDLLTEDRTEPATPIEAIAAIHGALAYGRNEGRFADRIKDLLVDDGTDDIDLMLARTIFRLQAEWNYEGPNPELEPLLRRLVSELAVRKPIYGHSIRLLAGNYSIIQQNLRETPGGAPEEELGQIRAWLAKSYVGSHLAVREGLPEADRNEFIVTKVKQSVIRGLVKNGHRSYG